MVVTYDALMPTSKCLYAVDVSAYLLPKMRCLWRFFGTKHSVKRKRIWIN